MGIRAKWPFFPFIVFINAVPAPFAVTFYFEVCFAVSDLFELLGIAFMSSSNLEAVWSGF